MTLIEKALTGCRLVAPKLTAVPAASAAASTSPSTATRFLHPSLHLEAELRDQLLCGYAARRACYKVAAAGEPRPPLRPGRCQAAAVRAVQQ